MKILPIGFVFLLGALGPCAAAGQPPFWSGSAMTGEPLLFVQEEGAPAATAHLLFKAAKDFRLTSPDGKVIYEEGRDYAWQPGSDIVTRTAQSRIPFKTHAEIYPPIRAAHSFGKTVDGKSGVLWSEGTYFHDLQALAGYSHDEPWAGAVPPAGSTGLERTLAKLRAKQPLKIVLLGDSISAGYNASGFVHAPPFQPSYGPMFAATLQERFGSPVTVTNLSMAGQPSAWAPIMAPKVVAAKGDLVLIAFGMNDRGPASQFMDNIGKTVATVRAASPNVDFILVSGMAGNSALADFPVARFAAYRDALRTLQGPGVAVADVTSVWLDLVRRKSFLSCTGNGVSHPNDLGHRLYADVLAALFPQN